MKDATEASEMLKPCDARLLQCLSAALSARHHAAQKDVAHFTRELIRVGINPRVVPGIDPIHHAEQAEYRDAGGELHSPGAPAHRANG